MPKLLLLSNSTLPGQPYLAWAADPIRAFLPAGVERLLFIPFAGVTFSWDEYVERVADGLEGLSVTGIHAPGENPIAAIEEAQAVAIGGGNTFRLLERLQALGLQAPLRRRALAGLPIIGWSAGSNVCGPSICTTNDMPIIEPASFEALNLVRFQINPHYTEATLSGHGGESRRQRLAEFLALKPEARIAGIPEGGYLSYEGEVGVYRGPTMHRFAGPGEPEAINDGARFDLDLTPL